VRSRNRRARTLASKDRYRLRASVQTAARLDKRNGRWIGQNKLAVLNFAVMAVALIAIIGALSSLLEKYLTTNVGQWVMHDLRRTLYHHIHRLSLAEHDAKRTGDLIGRVTSDIRSDSGLCRHSAVGILANALTLLGSSASCFT